MRTKLLVAALLLASAAVGRAEDRKTGIPELKSATALAFGPKGVLFVGDSAAATIYAIDTGDTTPAGNKALNVEQIDSKVAAVLGVTAKDVKVTDMKVNPASGNVYLSATRSPTSSAPALVKVARDGTVTAVALKDLPFTSVKLPNPSTSAKGAAAVVTQMAFVDGKLIVAGLSSEEFASTLRVIPYPFKDADKGTGIQIFHAAHNGALETHSPIRSFVAYKIGQEDNIMAAYTCTPLVKIPVADLKPGAKVKGKTIGELGNRNNPLDMIVYTKGGKDYILMANSARGVMKIPTAEFGSAAPLTAAVAGGGTAGVTFETVKELTDVMQLDKLNDENALVLVKAGAGFDLKTVPLP